MVLRAAACRRGAPAPRGTPLHTHTQNEWCASPFTPDPLPAHLLALAPFTPAPFTPVPTSQALGTERDKLLLEIDTNGDGRVCFEEFERFFLDKQGGAEAGKRLIMHRVENADNITVHSDVEMDRLKSVMSEAIQYWDELDTERTGTLGGAELDKILAFVFGMLSAGGGTTTDEDIAADSAMARRFCSEPMTWPKFEALLSTLLKRNAEFEVMLAEASADFTWRACPFCGKCEAQEVFARLDSDHTGYLEGAEVQEMSRWVFGEFVPPGGVPLTQDQVACQAKKMLREIDGDGDAKVSYINTYGHTCMHTHIHACAGVVWRVQP